MLAKDLVLRNPFRFLENSPGFELIPGQFGAVVARAGVGKTAFLVQLALFSLLRNHNVLHISLSEPVNKVAFRYDDVLHRIAEDYKMESIDPLREEFLPHRFIMTFKVASFDPEVLQERLNDLTVQKIFAPDMIIIDGLRFEETSKSLLAQLKVLAENLNMPVWIAVLVHRSEPLGANGLPASFQTVADFFKTIVHLQPHGHDIFINALTGEATDAQRPHLLLDPTTLLIKEAHRD